MPILQLSAIENTPLQKDPFDFFVASNAIAAEDLEALNADYPDIRKASNYPVEGLACGPAFARLISEMKSPEFEAAVARKLQVDLTGTSTTITARKFSEPSDGNIHTDHWSKLVTVLVYFNPEWTQEGGRLRFLRDKNDIESLGVEVIPIGGTVLAFRRSEKSFHGYKPFEGERRMVQMSWLRPGRKAWFALQFTRFRRMISDRLAKFF